ncbi:MAG: hypothetical protein Hyperionvirus6_60 [Hyperionvirus sp.]|uniref:Uncharacterized protein n=1 Tax=Hyperionvirus sp. TaxID=2487770 RepID=A0A3G5ADD8_9VIRU|nr:MAG: hypothetical protein Hyperionvirus6_60 [Hyperionvirus sp.]
MDEFDKIPLVLLFEYLCLDDLLMFNLVDQYMHKQVSLKAKPWIEASNQNPLVYIKSFRNCKIHMALSYKVNIDWLTEFGKNIVSLSFYRCLDNISVDSVLTKVNYLKLEHTNIIADSGLQNLVNLRNLSLRQGVSVTDAGIKALTNLRWLDLSKNEHITDEGLQHLTKLTTLILIANNNITNDGIKNLVGLKELSLKKTGRINIGGVKKLSNLMCLDISYRGGMDGMDQLTNLRRLTIDFNSDVANGELKLLTNLEILSMIGCGYILDTTIGCLTNLEALDISCSTISVSSIIQLTKLQYLCSLRSNLTRYQTGELALRGVKFSWPYAAFY